MFNTTSGTCFFLETTHQPSKYFDALNLACLILHAVSFLPAAIGIGVVTLTTYKTPSLQKPSFVLLSSAALADSLTGLLVQPVAMASFAAKMRRQFSAACWLDVIKECLGWLFGGISVSILALLSVERYLALHLGLRYQAVITMKRVLQTVAVFWLILLVLGVLRLLVISNKAFVAIHLPFMFLTLLVLTATYSRIHHFIKRHRLKLSPAENQELSAFDLAKYKKITWALLYIIGVYWLFFAPFVCVLVVYLSSGFTKSVEGAYYVTTTFILVNAAVNPVLYCWKLRALRQAVWKNVKQILHLDSEWKQTNQCHLRIYLYKHILLIDFIKHSIKFSPKSIRKKSVCFCRLHEATKRPKRDYRLFCTLIRVLAREMSILWSGKETDKTLGELVISTSWLKKDDLLCFCGLWSLTQETTIFIG